MFREKCLQCGRKISKKYDFCPYCGTDAKSQKNKGDYGFLGQSDFNDLDMKLPFGFNTLMKPLMKELSKQMVSLDKELKKEQEDAKNKSTKVSSSFSIHIGIPGQKPIIINSGFPMGQSNLSVKKSTILNFPKIDPKKLENARNIPRKEPKTIVRRLSNGIIYEIYLPGVSSLEDINIAKLEDSLEIKALSDKEVFLKTMDITLPIKNYSFKDGILVLELGAR